jgi:GntR family transcriptional regulator
MESKLCREPVRTGQRLLLSGRKSRVNIIISNSSGKPIYEQIVTQIRQMIMDGDLHAGDPLPSMRFLAQELRISVITTKRAYEELARDGFITNVVGKGSFVADVGSEILREEGLREIEQRLLAAVDRAKAVRLSKGEFLEIVDTLWEDNL